MDAAILIAAAAAAFLAARPVLPDLRDVIHSIERARLADADYLRALALVRPHTLHRRSVVGLAGSLVGSAIYGPRPPSLPRTRGQAIAIADDLTALAFPALTAFTLAWLAVRLRRPRPPWGELRRTSTRTVRTVAYKAVTVLETSHASAVLRLSARGRPAAESL